MFKLFAELRRTGLLTPTGLLRLLEAVATTGANPMALLRIAAKLNPQRIAVSDGRQRLSYLELWQQAESVAIGLHSDYGVRGRRKVAIACRDHSAAIKSIFAASRLGAYVFMVNPGMSPDQLMALHQRMQFDFWVYDDQLDAVFSEPSMRKKSLPAYHPTDESIDRISSSPRREEARLRESCCGKYRRYDGGDDRSAQICEPQTFLFHVSPTVLCLTHSGATRQVSVRLYCDSDLSWFWLGVAVHGSRSSSDNVCLKPF